MLPIKRLTVLSKLILRGSVCWGIKATLAISEKGDLSVGEKLLEKAKSFPMSSEERAKLIGGQANLLLAATQVSGGFAVGRYRAGRYVCGGSRFARF